MRAILICKVRYELTFVTTIPFERRARADRGYEAINVVLDLYPDEVRNYQAGQDTALRDFIERQLPQIDAHATLVQLDFNIQQWKLDDAQRRGQPIDITAFAGSTGAMALVFGGSDCFFDPLDGFGGGGGSRPGRAPEYLGGQITERQFVDATLNYLGLGYREVSSGRYVSKDGLRQVRYGEHEMNNAIHHGHFEAYDQSYYTGGIVVENTRVIITP